MDYDLIVIGGGTAVIDAAGAADKLSAKLAIVEQESIAGTCLLRGKGIFSDPTDINVDRRNYSTEEFVIATGAQPAPPAIPGAKRLVVIGGANFDTMAS